MPTGSGKTIVLCGITNLYLSENPHKNIVVLSHNSKILSQDHQSLSEYFPEIEIGLYSAGLKTREVRKITVAGIQSVWRCPDKFSKTGLIIIDEAHLVNHEEEGMYRSFISKIECNVCGLTATPYRLNHGYIYKGQETVFDSLSYDLSSPSAYVRLIEDGYLSPMRTLNTKLKVDTSGVKLKGLEIDEKGQKEKFDRPAITDIACNEILGASVEFNLKKMLIFAIDIEHAENVRLKMIELGVSCETVHSKKNGNEEIIEKFENGEIKCVVNVQKLTTGLDIIDIDLIGVLRATNSPSLHVQMLGRGGRPVYLEGCDLSTRKNRRLAIEKGKKPFCLIMDFAGNTDRIGPINNVSIDEDYSEKIKSGGKGVAITKVCPQCNMLSFTACKKCDSCGHEFKFKEKISTEISSVDPIYMGKESENYGWIIVKNVYYKIKSTPGKPSSLMVVYNTEKGSFREYVCIDHGGVPRGIANRWIRDRISHGDRKPRNLSELYAIRAKLRVPYRIAVEKSGRYTNIKKHDFAQIAPK